MHVLFFNIYRSRFFPAEIYEWPLKGVAARNSCFSLFLCPQSSIPPCLMVCSLTGLCGVCCPDWSGLWQHHGGFTVISSHSWLTNKQSPKAMWLHTHKNGLNTSCCLEKPMTWICWCGCWLMTNDPWVCVQRRQNSNIIKIYSNFIKTK